MKTIALLVLPILLAVTAGEVRAEDPNLGYLFPAGGKQGSTIDVLAGGQRLYGLKEVLVTGEGVEIEVVQHYRSVRNINGDQRKLLTRMLKDRHDELTGKPKKVELPQRKVVPKKKAPTKKIATTETDKKTDKKEEAKKKEVKEAPPIKLPAHPMLENIEKMDLRELEVVRRTFLRANRNQLNPQIAELVTLRVKIAPGAEPGDRAVRMVTSSGLSNPVCFQVGLLPEWKEAEPNEPRIPTELEPVPPLRLPVVVNGQVMPGDIDRIRFRAKKGEPVVVDARARRLIPYLADAVPGWFQIVVALLDESGREVAYADDFRFHPDPMFRYVIPEDGIYQLEVRDSIYRGREDFVYRIRLGRVPVITEMFPLGAQVGRTAAAQVRGWNLPTDELEFDVCAEGGPVREASLTTGGWHTNAVSYAVDPLPQAMEREPNNSAKDPQAMTVPKVINGRIGKPGDVDVFRFVGRKGQEVVAEVQARGLSSPLDSKLTLLDGRGVVVAWNDDHMEKDGHLHLGTGLITHHADSYLRAKLPVSGPYYLVLADSQSHGGSAYSYRLRLSEPRPGFRVMVSPSTVQAPAGGHASIWFHIAREDGYDGPVSVEMVDAPAGYRLHGAVIPAGEDHVRATLESPVKAGAEILEIKFQAEGQQEGREIITEVQPADDRMQAFLWRHLVTTDKFLVMPKGWKQYGLALESTEVVKVKPGSSVDVRILAKEGSLPMSLRLSASDPPKGITVTSAGMLSDGFFLTIEADKSVKPGMSGNLIVEGWMQPAAKKGKKASRPQLMGTLPPVPFEIISP